MTQFFPFSTKQRLTYLYFHYKASKPFTLEFKFIGQELWFNCWLDFVSM